MEGVDVENGSAIARPEADAATAAKEAAKQVVAALSRRVRGIDKATGTVAGYARPGVDRLHTLRDVDDLRIKSTEAVAQSLLLPHSAETWRHSASTHHGGAAAVQPRVEA